MPSKREIEMIRLTGLAIGIVALPFLLGSKARRRSAPQTPAGPSGVTPDEPSEANASEHEGDGKVIEGTPDLIDEAIKSHTFVIVYVYTTWCGGCRLAAPVLEREAAMNRNVRVYKLDADKYSDYARQLGAEGYPYFILFINGEQVEEYYGGPSSKSNANAWFEGSLKNWFDLASR